jgi:hypothetical protein
MINLVKWRHLTVFLILTTAVYSCWLGPNAEKKENQLWIESVYSGIHGSHVEREPSVKWITSSEQLRVLFSEFEKKRLSDKTIPMPDINFNRSWVLLIETGQKPTGGYSVSLNSAGSHILSKTAVIRINWNEPSQDAQVTQMVTNPFLMLRLSKSDFTKAVVIDQENRKMFEVDVPR